MHLMAICTGACIMCFIVFFFFKQKTAYEMRISDWSSDVCSSDLLTPADLQSRVKDSNLRGRGGAGFPTGVKWGLVPMGPDAGAKYLVCNAEDRKSVV